jgi:hypothetical protein
MNALLVFPRKHWSPILISLVVLLSLAYLVGYPRFKDSGFAAARNVGVDLGIGEAPGLGQPGVMSMTKPTTRPGILVAWRNTEKILEVETLVTNRGTTAGKGRLEVEILDGEHNVLAKRPLESQPFVVTIPAASDGGLPGTTVQIPGTYQLNKLLDELDRTNDVYCLRVRIETLDVVDSDLLNNTSIKCYNTSSKLVSKGISFHRFYLRNTQSQPVEGEVLIQRPELPQGWEVLTEPKPGTKMTLQPGQFVIGLITVRAPETVKEGDYLDIRPTLIDSSRKVIDGSEFYVAADSQPPSITRAMVAPGREPNSVYLVVRAVDSVSGVAEASGASVEWSTDTGFTMNKRTLTYQDGNFLSATGFDTDLGPFPDGVKVKLTIIVQDVTGNSVRTKEIEFQVPLDKPLELGL